MGSEVNSSQNSRSYIQNLRVSEREGVHVILSDVWVMWEIFSLQIELLETNAPITIVEILQLVNLW